MQELGRAGVSAVVVDVTDNPGGTDWALDVAGAISTVPLMCPQAAGIRHPHWQDLFQQLSRELESCDVSGLAPSNRALLEDRRARNAKLLRESRERCDLFGLFEGKAATCSLVLDASPRASCDPAPLDGPIQSPLPETCSLFQQPEHSPAHGLVRVPVFVLINRSTGSAAEEFAAVLKDNGVATLVGEQTVGAGCGYTNNGIALKLAHSGIAVAAPDCSRYRVDGTNETEGIKPDVAVSWTLSDMTGRWASYAEKALSEAGQVFSVP
jgi:hypothetical protein